MSDGPLQVHLAGTGDVANRSKVDSQQENTPKVIKMPPEIRANRATVAAEWTRRHA